MEVSDILKFDESQLRVRLRSLPSTHRVLFASACAQRLVGEPPEEINLRNQLEKVQELMSSVWEALLSGDMPDVEGGLAYCESLCVYDPDLVPDGEEGSKMIEDAAMAVAGVLTALKSGEPEDALEAARIAFDAADSAAMDAIGMEVGIAPDDGYLIGSPGTVPELPGATVIDPDQIRTHELVQTELRRQQRDIDELAIPQPFVDAVLRFRARSLAERIERRE